MWVETLGEKVNYLANKVELPIIDHYRITKHFFRSSSSVLFWVN
jgi:hypothetical protein